MNPKQPLRFGGPADYRISVQGKLTRSLIDSFSGIRIFEEFKPDGIIITTISIRIKDQAELSGIINALYEWGLPLISVECNDNHFEGSER